MVELTNLSRRSSIRYGNKFHPLWMKRCLFKEINTKWIHSKRGTKFPSVSSNKRLPRKKKRSSFETINLLKLFLIYAEEQKRIPGRDYSKARNKSEEHCLLNAAGVSKFPSSILSSILSGYVVLTCRRIMLSCLLIHSNNFFPKICLNEDFLNKFWHFNARKIIFVHTFK